MKQSIFPLFLAKPKAVVKPSSSRMLFDSYSLGQENFAKLADRQLFEQQSSSYIHIDISDECAEMTEESFLEIIVPVLNLNDIMGAVKELSPLIRHPILLMVNGYGAKRGNENSFPHVDFVNVIDVADNRYEIVVSPTGKLECAAEGSGLYSIIKEITYVLTHRQVIKGEGLEDLSIVGGRKKTIALQAPICTHENFTFHICLTHLDKNNRRIVDSIRPVDIHFLPPSLKADFPILSPRWVYIKFDSTTSPVSSKENLGWEPHPLHHDVWTRRCGLQLATRKKLIKLLYTEHEFMRDFLMRKVLSFSSLDNYNNFLLRPETFSMIYKKFIHDLVYGYISKETLENLLDEKAFDRIDFSALTSDAHDNEVLLQLKKESETQENKIQYLLSAMWGDLAFLLPPTCAQFAMLPVIEENSQVIPELPSEWMAISPQNCSPRPRM